MKVVRLKQTETDLFFRLDSFEKLSLLGMPGIFAFGVIDDANPINPKGAGLVIGDIGDKRVTINWIMVAKAYRKKGICELMLRAVFETAGSLNIEEVGLMISGEYEVELHSLRKSGYFKNRCFDDGTPALGEWWGELRDLSKEPVFSYARRNFPKAKPLMMFPSRQLPALIAELADGPGRSEIYSVEKHPERILPEISFVLEYANELCGAILGECMEDVIVPVLFFAESQREAIALFRSFYDAALKQYGAESMLYIPGRSQGMQQIITQIIPKRLQKGRLFLAKASDYDKLYY